MILPKKQRSTKTSTQATRHCPNKQIHFPILQQVAVSVKNARPSLQYETSNMGFNWVSLSQDIWTQVFLSANVNKTGQFSQHRWPETRTVHSLSPHVWEFDPGSLTVRLKPTSPGFKLFLQSHGRKLWEKPDVGMALQPQPESKLSFPKHTRTTRQILWLLNLSVLRSSLICSSQTVS